MSGHGHDSGHGKGHGESHEEHEESEEHSDEHEESHEEEHEEHAHEDHGHSEHKEEKKEKIVEKKEKYVKKKSVGEIGILTLILIAVVVRLATNYAYIYSVEPIIPIAVYAGLAYGSEAGILVGLVSYPLSNLFLIGGAFGLWSFLQGIGGAIAGWLAGTAKKVTKSGLVTYTIIGTLIFEVIMNFPNQELLVWPFSITHIVSNIVFAIIIGELLVKEK
ncbi:MAG TPA: hypothetical protein VJH23_04450 [archaeon]|nr:hypothetical protein [archaeon]